MSGPLYVISTGARTPLGLDSSASAAAVRAGISSCSQHPFLVDQAGDSMPASMDPLLQPDLPCRERMLALARMALEEACTPFLNQHQFAAVPLMLGLPEPRPGLTTDDAEWIGLQLAKRSHLPVQISEHRAYMSGHSSVLFLIDQARQEMAQGKYDTCLVGGVESYFHPDTMEWLDGNRQLTGSVSRSGFVPGEGAGFCLIMTPAAAQRQGLNSIAFILNSANGWETNLIKSQDINLGEGLTQVVRNTVNGIDPERETVSSIYCDINGERYRGEEWGFTCLKLARYFTNPTGYVSPAECWGDMGAASGGLFMALSTQAALRGYAPGKRSLLWAGSESGLRASALVEAEVIPSPYRG